MRQKLENSCAHGGSKREAGKLHQAFFRQCYVYSYTNYLCMEEQYYLVWNEGRSKRKKRKHGSMIGAE